MVPTTFPVPMSFCFEPLAALAQWLVPPASSELCQHVAAPNVGAMHIVLEGLSPSGNSSGFLICILPILPTNRSEVFCHHQIWKHFQKPKRGTTWTSWCLPIWDQKGTQIQVCSWQALALALESQWHRPPSRFLWSKIWAVHSQNPMAHHHFPYRMGHPQL